MNQWRTLAGLAFLVWLLGSGCSTDPRPQPSWTSVKVSGTRGTLFTYRYVWAGNTGALSTIVWDQPVEVLRFDGHSLEECVLEKSSGRGELVLEIYHKTERELLVVLPVGRRGLKATLMPAGWRHEWY